MDTRQPEVIRILLPNFKRYVYQRHPVKTPKRHTSPLATTIRTRHADYGVPLDNRSGYKKGSKQLITRKAVNTILPVCYLTLAINIPPSNPVVSAKQKGTTTTRGEIDFWFRVSNAYKMDHSAAGFPPSPPQWGRQTGWGSGPVYANHRQAMMPSCNPTDSPVSARVVPSATATPSEVVAPSFSLGTTTNSYKSFEPKIFPSDGHPRIFIANTMFDSPMMTINNPSAVLSGHVQTQTPMKQEPMVHDLYSRSRKRARTGP